MRKNCHKFKIIHILGLMVRIKYIIREGALVLRISEGKERFYKSTNHLLVGTPNLKYWEADKERFSYRCSSYIENNEELARFKNIYKRLTSEHPELTARQIASFYRPGTASPLKSCQHSVEEYLKVVIEREKSKPGQNFMFYTKLLQKCRKVIPGFSSLTFQAIDFDLCLKIANIFAKHKNYRGASKGFRALLGKADSDQNVEFSIKQIGGFRFQHYNPDKYIEGIAIPNVLNAHQLKTFLNLNAEIITPTYKNRSDVKLYYDFCLFMFYTFLAPCDVIKLDCRNVSKRNTLVLRRRKTCKLVEIPIHPAVSEIIAKYRSKGDSTYIFPIMSRSSSREYKTRDYLCTRFRENLNKWLKVLGEELQLDFSLHSYVFRHTAISTAINGGLPLSYAAVLAGVKAETIQRYYYHGNTIDNVSMFHRIFTDAAGV